MGRPKEGATENFADILQRIRETTHTRGLSDLGRILGIGPSSVKRTLDAERIPGGWIRCLCDKGQIEAVWLLTGQGPKLITDSLHEVDGSNPKMVEPPQSTKEREDSIYREKYYAGLERENQLLRKAVSELEKKIEGKV